MCTTIDSLARHGFSSEKNGAFLFIISPCDGCGESIYIAVLSSGLDSRSCDMH